MDALGVIDDLRLFEFAQGLNLGVIDGIRVVIAIDLPDISFALFEIEALDVKLSGFM